MAESLSEQDEPDVCLSSRVAMWQHKAEEHRQKQLINPFSDWDGASHRAKMSKDDVNYGRPVAGSSTERRGKQAGQLISAEILELCQVISELGQRHQNGSYTITFGQLFAAYETISNKLVGILMRARKQHLIDFQGEMLFQRRDEEVLITLHTYPVVGS